MITAYYVSVFKLSDTLLSQSGSDSPSKKEKSGLNSPVKAHKPMSGIQEETNEGAQVIYKLSHS